MVGPMLPERFHEALAELVVERLDQVMPDDPDGAVAWLEEVLGDPERTDELLRGEGLDLSEPERTAVADTLLLEPVLLGALFTATSPEVLLHMLREIVPGDSGECDQCETLAARVASATTATPADDLEDIVFDALCHLVCDAPPLDDSHWAELVDVFSTLSTAGRLRVLAAAYEEDERERRGAAVSPISELARAREEHLSGPARDVVALLAQAPTGSLSATDLVSSLALPGVGALAPIEQSLEQCGRVLASHDVADSLVVKVHRSGQAHYSLHPALIGPMRALLRAEQHAGSDGDA